MWNCGRWLVVLMTWSGCAVAPPRPSPAPVVMVPAEPPAEPNAKPTPEPTAYPDPVMPKPTHVLPYDTAVELDAGTTLRVEQVIIETIEPSPDGAYPAGGAVEVALVLERGSWQARGSLLDITEGYEGRMVVWLGEYRVALVEVKDMHVRPEVSVAIETVEDTRTDAPPESVRVEVGQTLTFEGGVGMEFVGHSHKRTHEGQSSPLIVELRWHVPGEEPAMEYESLETSEDQRTWRWRDREFELVDWDYGDWMSLKMFRLRRARVGSP